MCCKVLYQNGNMNRICYFVSSLYFFFFVNFRIISKAEKAFAWNKIVFIYSCHFLTNAKWNCCEKKTNLLCDCKFNLFFTDEDRKCRHRAHFVWCNSCDEILLDSTLIMYYPAASDPVGWYQNLLNNVSDPVKMYESLTGNRCETPGSFRVWCIMFHSPKNCPEKDPWIRAKCKHRQSSFIKRSNTEREHRCIPIDFIFFRHGTQTFFRVPTRNLAYFF